MKHALVFLTLTLFFFTAKAQDKTYFLYKGDYKGTTYRAEVKSNDNYIALSKPGQAASVATYMPTRLLDLKDGVGVIYNDKTKTNRWYHIEELDTLYKNRSTLQKGTETKTIDGYKCQQYTAEAELDFDGTGFMGAQTTKVTYSYILWITTDIKAGPVLSKYLLASITGNILYAELPGVVVKMEYVQKRGKKTISEGDFVLEKASTEKLKDSEVTLPWTEDDVKPSAPCSEEITRNSGNRADSRSKSLMSIWTNEDSKPFEERLRKLFLKVTGKEVKYFNLVRILPYI